MKDILDGALLGQDIEDDYTPDIPRGGILQEDVDIASLDNAKAYYATLINDYRAGRIPRDQARTLGYLMAGYLGYFKVEIEQDMERRIEAIEKLLEERNS